MQEKSKGALFLVPAPLDFGCTQQAAVTDVLPAGTLEVAARLTHWICENAKSTRAFLKRVSQSHPLALPLQQLHIEELPREVHKKGDHFGQFDARPLLHAASEGVDIGLMSEAGMPAVADPGSSVVRAAHDLLLDVVPLVGPVSILMALAASGLNGQGFAFCGYLPQEVGPRAARIRELENLAQATGQTQVFIETPYRNAAMWDALLKTLQPSTRLAVAAGLTLPHAVIRSRPVKAWRSCETPLGSDLPAVFALGR